ncbi:MAG: hypothetical protein ABFD90_13890 [Phycisphaerales bacterium]
MTMAANGMRQKGIFTAELMVGMALLGLALVGLAVSIQGISLFNRYQWTRQRCMAAAEAQLDSLATTGRPIDEAEIKRLWPDVAVAIERTPGAGPWERLELLRVTATGKAGPHAVMVRLERYVREDR